MNVEGVSEQRAFQYFIYFLSSFLESVESQRWCSPFSFFLIPTHVQLTILRKKKRTNNPKTTPNRREQRKKYVHWARKRLAVLVRWLCIWINKERKRGNAVAVVQPVFNLECYMQIIILEHTNQRTQKKRSRKFTSWQHVVLQVHAPCTLHTNPKSSHNVKTSSTCTIMRSRSCVCQTAGPHWLNRIIIIIKRRREKWNECGSASVPTHREHCSAPRISFTHQKSNSAKSTHLFSRIFAASLLNDARHLFFLRFASTSPAVLRPRIRFRCTQTRTHALRTHVTASAIEAMHLWLCHN